MFLNSFLWLQTLRGQLPPPYHPGSYGPVMCLQQDLRLLVGWMSKNDENKCRKTKHISRKVSLALPAQPGEMMSAAHHCVVVALWWFSMSKLDRVGYRGRWKWVKLVFVLCRSFSGVGCGGGAAARRRGSRLWHTDNPYDLNPPKIRSLIKWFQAYLHNY